MVTCTVIVVSLARHNPAQHNDRARADADATKPNVRSATEAAAGCAVAGAASACAGAGCARDASCFVGSGPRVGHTGTAAPPLVRALQCLWPPAPAPQPAAKPAPPAALPQAQALQMLSVLALPRVPGAEALPLTAPLPAQVPRAQAPAGECGQPGALLAQAPLLPALPQALALQARPPSQPDLAAARSRCAASHPRDRLAASLGFQPRSRACRPSAPPCSPPRLFFRVFLGF